QRAFLEKREAEMVGAMSGRGDGFDLVARALPSLAVGENRVRRIIAVMRRVETGRPVAARRKRSGADHSRARGRAKLVRADAMIAMGMADEDRLDPLAVNRGEQGRKMR